MRRVRELHCCHEHPMCSVQGTSTSKMLPAPESPSTINDLTEPRCLAPTQPHSLANPTRAWQRRSSRESWRRGCPAALDRGVVLGPAQLSLSRLCVARHAKSCATNHASHSIGSLSYTWNIDTGCCHTISLACQLSPLLPSSTDTPRNMTGSSTLTERSSRGVHQRVGEPPRPYAVRRNDSICSCSIQPSLPHSVLSIGKPTRSAESFAISKK